MAGGVKVALASQSVDYLRGPAAPLLITRHLGLYVSAAESTSYSDPSILEAQSLLSQIRQSFEKLPRSDPKLSFEIRSKLSRIREILGRQWKTDSALRTLEALVNQVGKITDVADEPGLQPARWAIEAQEAIDDMTPLIDELDQSLRELRRRASIGTT